MLTLYRENTLVMRLTLGERPLEVGRAAGCDVVIDDPELAERHWLLMRQHGTVVAYDISACGRSSGAQHVALGARLAIGRHHALIRQDERAQRDDKDATPEQPASAGKRGRAGEHDTEALVATDVPASWLGIVVGRGPSARALRVGEGPLHVGRASGNDLELTDRAVSARHLRLEPCGRGLLLRDLGSINGTLVNGVRVETAFVQAGAHIRLGRTDLHVVERDARDASGTQTLVARSAVMLSALADAEKAARLEWPALVLGESGTGKEAVARMLHDRGPRRGKPYVTINAGGVPGELIESELFGHERGAFTGAHGMRRGVFEQADGGTLFLDEIGELPLSLQARLLRVLESGEVRRVGAESARNVDVRLVCATHRDLRALAAVGEFRADLYFRIARLVIELPPLRARLDDVGPIAEHVLAGLASSVGPRALSDDALSRLRGHSWPGNVRELRNVVSAAAVASCGHRIERVDVEQALAKLSSCPAGRALSLETLEEALHNHAGNVSAAARALGVARSTLRDRLRERARREA